MFSDDFTDTLKSASLSARMARGGSDVDMEDYAAVESQVEAALARQNPQ